MTTSALDLAVDRSRINIDHSYELQWWSAELSVSPAMLCELVAERGPNPAEIRKHLADAARISFKGGGED